MDTCAGVVNLRFRAACSNRVVGRGRSHKRRSRHHVTRFGRFVGKVDAHAYPWGLGSRKGREFSKIHIWVNSHPLADAHRLTFLRCGAIFAGFHFVLVPLR